MLKLSMLGTIMDQNCPLSAPLVLTDIQGGFAGEIGNVWTIAPDCTFTIARQVGLAVLEPYKQGLLTSEQRARLIELLARMTATELPERLGDGQVNARRITFTYGGKQTVLSLPPGGGDLTALRTAATDDSTRVIIELAADLKAITDD